MMPLRKKIIDLLSTKPGLRTMQLCDMLDVPIDEVEEELEDLLALSILEKRDAIAPNGRRATEYWPLGYVEQKIVESVTHKPAPVKEMTKVDKAISFIKEQPSNSATSSQLHVVMGLKATEAPSQYLANAISNGRLVKDGKIWSLGGASPAAGLPVMPKVTPRIVSVPPVPPEPPVAEPMPVPDPMLVDLSESGRQRVEQSEFNVSVALNPTGGRSPNPNIPRRVDATPVPVPKNDGSVVIPPGAGFQCSIWCNGDLVLCRDDSIVMRLSRTEVDHMNSFIGRVTM
jgi:hypothetical protein